MKKERKSIQIGIFYHLKKEIENILKCDLEGTSRLWFSIFSKNVVEEFNSLESIKNDLIIKYGISTEDGNYSIVEKLDDGTENPNYNKFFIEFNEILIQEKEIEYYPLLPEYFTKVENKELDYIYNFVKI